MTWSIILGQSVGAQSSTRRIAWDQSLTPAVTGWALTVDGVRTDYGLAPRAADGTCGCSLPLPFSSGRHVLVVSAYNSGGETSSAPFTVGPTAHAGGPYSGQAGTPVGVTAAGSSDASGTIVNYRWNWGDGTNDTSSSGSTTSHTYATGGTFTITLTVTDNYAADGTTTTTAIIAGPQGPGTPFAPNPTTGATNVTTSPTLTWAASGATSYDVRFGTTNPPPQVTTSQTSASYTTGALSPNTVYYWRVIARNSGGTATGPTWSFTTMGASTGGTDVVIYAGDVAAGDLHGSWTHASDGSSPENVKLMTGDAGWASTNSPQSAPAEYMELEFNAPAGAAYTLWLRMRALNDSKYNDAVWVQFSDALANGSPVYPLDSSSGLLVNLATDSGASSLRGWGWQNGAYWLGQPATFTFASSGSHRLRIQVREDGVQVDQIVLSSSTYLTTSPGAVTNDTTIVPKPQAPPAVPGAPTGPSPSDGSANVNLAPTLTWSASGATSYDVYFGTANPPPQVEANAPNTSYAPSSLVEASTYYWRVVARNNAGATSGPIWSFTTAAAPPTSSSDIVIYASDVSASQLHGAWTKEPSASGAGGFKLTTLDAGWSSLNAPLANPAHYIDVVFDAQAGTAYTLWLRLRGLNDNKFNDAVWVQFSDARVDGSPVYPLNSTSGLLVNLATSSNASSLNGWGWQNGAYWLSQPATLTFDSSGSHTLRIQLREDGVQLDQIVLSPSTYLTSAPGPPTSDSTIVPK